MSRHKAWANNLHRGSTAIIAPNLTPKLVRKSHVVFLLQLPCMATQAQPETYEIKADSGSTEFSNDHNQNIPMEEGEIVLDKEESTSKEEGVLEKQFELWPILVDAVVQFNRIAFNHYSIHNLLVRKASLEFG
ncbi:hypothetical protein DSO57_1025100 [Entomophthora muscae]|uniref:Uncharacterized protein n=1 Tax=Entomophthora muscae TaxID=34485 RepID=A0ACC2UBW5_9FUNG|nr:hypothetical protein DSO57_1025100 [Entomophthora muscae]